MIERLFTNSPWEADGQAYSEGEGLETGTLLHFAAAAGDTDSVERLLARGVKPDEPNWEGKVDLKALGAPLPLARTAPRAA